MKNLILKTICLTGALLLTCACEQRNSIAKIENELLKEAEESELFAISGDKLTNLILTNPKTMHYSFQQLVDNGYLNVTTSDDGGLRFYSWDTGKGETIIDYDNAYQYQSNGKIFSYAGTPVGDDYDSNDSAFGIRYDTIYAVNVNDKTCYLAVSGQHDARRAMQGVTAYTINNDKLETIELFKTSDEKRSGIYVAYNFADWVLLGYGSESWDKIFAYNYEENVLYVPLVDDEHLTDQYLLYKLNEDCFEYIGKDGGYWLHPSIRKFERLEEEFNTKDFHIRLDYMGKNKYRYASWPEGKSIANEPDLIIENGTVDDDDLGWGKDYFFENGGYKYIVYGFDMEGFVLVVEKNGKEILRQETIHDEDEDED